MPYKKRYRRKYKKKTGYPIYRFSRDVNYGLSTAYKALRLASYTKSLLNVEKKIVDTTSNASIPDTGTAQYLNFLKQGTDVSSREGNQVKFISLYLKYFMSISPNADDTTVRIIIVLDKQPNQSTYTLSDLLQDSTSPANIVSPLNIDNKFRFAVMYNKVHQMSQNGRRNIYAQKYMKMSIKTRYTDDTGTIADITTASIRLWFISDEVTNQPKVESYTRLRFVDN